MTAVWARYPTGRQWHPVNGWGTVTQSPTPGPGPVWEWCGLQWDPNTDTWNGTFTPPVTLTSISPSTGALGDWITLYGTNLLSADTSWNNGEPTVSFQNTGATGYRNWTDTSLDVQVPDVGAQWYNTPLDMQLLVDGTTDTWTVLFGSFMVSTS